MAFDLFIVGVLFLSALEPAARILRKIRRFL